VIRRASFIAVLVALAGGWIAYVHVWRYGDVRPLAYRLVTVPNFEATHPLSSITTRGQEERVLITAGPRSSTGYSLEIESAVIERARISIIVREVDEPGRAEITCPYRLLVFPKADKPVHIHWKGRT
jgi:protease stability complex PrcB-like protein